MARYFIGLDIQTRRDCCYAVLDDEATLVDSGWLSIPEPETDALLRKWSPSGRLYMGLDAPRMPLTSKRAWYWNGTQRRWNRRNIQI